MSTDTERATFSHLIREPSLALTTFRKTGEAVATPLWFAHHQGVIYVETNAKAGKFKRLRHTSRVTLAPCTVSGKVTGEVSLGNARILTESQEIATAAEAMSKKYGFARRLWYFFRNTILGIQRKANVDLVSIAIELIDIVEHGT